MSEHVSYRTRALQPGRVEIALRSKVTTPTGRGERVGIVAQMPVDGDPNEMLSVLFNNEDNPRSVRLCDVRAVAAEVHRDDRADADTVLVSFYGTGAAGEGKPDRLSVFLYSSGNCSLVCDGWPVGRSGRIVPDYHVRRALVDDEGAEKAALFALNRLCEMQSDLFEVHAMDREALRAFVHARVRELRH
jgi:hypothetical protein